MLTVGNIEEYAMLTSKATVDIWPNRPPMNCSRNRDPVEGGNLAPPRVSPLTKTPDPLFNIDDTVPCG